MKKKTRFVRLLTLYGKCRTRIEQHPELKKILFPRQQKFGKLVVEEVSQKRVPWRLEDLL